MQSSIELATGSKRAGEVLAEPALMLATEGAFRLAKPALTAAKTGVKAAANAVRNLEVTLDSSAFLRHNTGVPFDAVKIGTKAPTTAAAAATGKSATSASTVVESGVSGAPVGLVYEDVAYHSTKVQTVQSKSGTQRKGSAPTDGQTNLNESILVKDSSTRRVSIIGEDRFVLFNQHRPGRYHGHIMNWKTLRQEAKNALIRAGKVTPNGKVIKQ